MTNPLHNLSGAQIADEYGSLKAQIDAIGERIDALKAELVARGADRVEGQTFTLTISKQTSTRLDTTALKAALGADICAEYEKTSESIVVRVKPTAVFGQQAA